MAYSDVSSNNSFMDWDLQSFGVFNKDMIMEDSSTAFLSTGYLEDAVMNWSNLCKRRRFLSYSSPQCDHDLQIVHNSPKNCWNHGDHEFDSEKFSYLTPVTPPNYNLNADEHHKSIQDDKDPLTSLENEFINNNIPTRMVKKKLECRKLEDQQENISSISPPIYINSLTKAVDGRYSPPTYSKSCEKRKIAYPFDMVKPGGIEGDLTLHDINERILMPPRRPIRHPVGDMGYNSTCVSPDGLSPTGKAVVALTKIHTQGRGTVTIIRTRG